MSSPSLHVMNIVMDFFNGMKSQGLPFVSIVGFPPDQIVRGSGGLSDPKTRELLANEALAYLAQFGPLPLHFYHWEVFSTCLGTHELMLQCRNTGSFGVVPRPSKAEWQRAFTAPSEPYHWPHNDRVVIKRHGMPQRPQPAAEEVRRG